MRTAFERIKVEYATCKKFSKVSSNEEHGMYIFCKLVLLTGVKDVFLSRQYN